MHIRHERPMPDLAFQVRAPLGLELTTGERVTIEEWSLSGFTFPGDALVLPREAVLSIPFQGVDIRFPVALDRDGTSRTLRFKNLTGRQRETLAIFHRSLLSGKMAATGDVITSLDTPVDLVPMGETEEEASASGAKVVPRGLRAAASVALYLLVGALVFYTLGSGIWGKLATVPIQNARIEAALVPHTAPARGYVKDVLVAPGDTVAQGDLLVRVTDPEGEAALADVRSRIELIERRLTAAENAEARAAQRIATARAQIEAAVHPTFPQVMRLLTDFDGRYAPAYADLFAAHDAVLAQVDTLADELRRLKRERGRLRDAADAMHIIAANAGTVTELPLLKGQMVARGTMAAVVERAEARQARGWLDPSMAAALHLGMGVTIQMASAEGPQTLRGEIARIEAGIDPNLSPAFGMLVHVTFPALSAEATQATLPHLTPVSLRAERPWAARHAEHWAAVKSWVGL
ncbi:MAG: HlyD family secretion protein [Shimia sp.]